MAASISSFDTTSAILKSLIQFQNSELKNKPSGNNYDSIFSDLNSGTYGLTDSAFSGSADSNLLLLSLLKLITSKTKTKTNKTTTTSTNSTSGTSAASSTSSTTTTTTTTTKQKTASDIDTDYLRANPDVATAVAKGQFKSGLDHYIKFGQKEGRAYDLANIGYNEYDYLKANPDVALAVAKGVFPNGLTHYMLAGINEGRKLK